MARSIDSIKRDYERCLEEINLSIDFQKRNHEKISETAQAIGGREGISYYEREFGILQRDMESAIAPLATKRQKLENELENHPDVKLNKLLDQVEEAQTSGEFRRLAKEFRKLDHEQSRRFADLCNEKAENLSAVEKAERIRIEEKRNNEMYNSLISSKQKATSWHDLAALGNQFRSMNGYRNTSELADECFNLSKKEKENVYTSLLLQKTELDANENSSADEYRHIADQLLTLGKDYNNVAELAAECRNTAVQQQFDRLVELKRQEDAKQTPDINAYQDLAWEFREIGRNYEAAIALADECESITKRQITADKFQTLIIKMQKAESEIDFNDLASEFEALGDFKATVEKAAECKNRSAAIRNARIHSIYTEANTEMQHLDSIRTSNPKELDDISRRWKKTAKKLDTIRDYKNADTLSDICMQRSDEASKKSEKIKMREKIAPIIAGRILQVIISVAFLYVLFGTEVIQGSIHRIHLDYSNVSDWLMLFLPLFFYTFLLCSFGSYFIPKKERYNYVYCIVAMVLQSILFLVWSNKYISLEFLEGLLYIGAFTGVVIAGMLIGFMESKKRIIITFTTISVITFVLGIVYLNGMVDDKEYHTVESPSEGMAAAEIGSFINRKWGFINEAGTEVIPCIYLSVRDFSEDLAAANLNGSWGFIDKNGNEVVPFIYDDVKEFSEGLAAVRFGYKNEVKWGFIDKNGNEVIPHIYSNTGSFSEGFAAVRKDRKTDI